MNAFAGEGTGHSHGPGDESTAMQVLGVLVILGIAGLGFWYLSSRKKWGLNTGIFNVFLRHKNLFF